MADNTFRSGVVPGGAFNKTEVEVLVCYILSKYSRPLTMDVFSEIILSTGLANFFDAASALDSLCHAGSVEKKDNNGYVLTEKGVFAFRSLINDIIPSQKEKIDIQIDKINRTAASKHENSATIEKRDNVYVVKCKVLDGKTELFSFEISVVDSDTAHHIVENFHGNTSSIYRSMVAILTGDASICQNL